jgi:hypothetical protein
VLHQGARIVWKNNGSYTDQLTLSLKEMWWRLSLLNTRLLGSSEVPALLTRVGSKLAWIYAARTENSVLGNQT